MGRPPCCHKANVKSGLWSPEEDQALKNFVQTHGYVGNWATLPHKAGLNRCGKSCRLRWLNYLRPDIKHGGFTHEEDNIICHLFKKMGSRWSFIASQLPGRTDNDVKNYWNTKLKKKYFINNPIHLPSQVSLTKPEQQNYFYSFSSTMTSDPSLNDQIPSPSTLNGGGRSPIHVPTRGVLPIKPALEIGSSTVNVDITTYRIDSLSNQDQISADPSSITSSLDNNSISWSVGDEDFDSFLMQDFGFDDELLNSFQFQDK